MFNLMRIRMKISFSALVKQKTVSELFLETILSRIKQLVLKRVVRERRGKIINN